MSNTIPPVSNINADLIAALFPASSPVQSLLPVSSPAGTVGSLLQDINKITTFNVQYKLQSSSKVDYPSPTDNYSRYLSYNDDSIKSLVASIVLPTDSNDVKMGKITNWVIDNVKYQDDWTTYHQADYWALPTETVKNKVGDCEDGAFLINSLGLAAGVPADRLRTYGGLVAAGTGAQTGGHGWTAYKREKDNQWVTLDWCYYPNKLPVDSRLLMKDDKKYIDDYFYVSGKVTVDTPYTNRIHSPDSYVVGSIINTTA